MSNQLTLFTEKDEFLDNLDRRIEIGNKIIAKQNEFNLIINELGQLNADHSGGYSRRSEYDRDKKPIVDKLFSLKKEIDDLGKQFMEVWNELSRPKK